MEKLTTQEVKTKIDNGESFLLDFYAEWCGPCKLLMSTLEEVEEDLKEKSIMTYKFDVDSDMSFPMSMGIRGVPTLLFYKDKRVVNKTSGGRMSPDEIMRFTEV
jgi:thioredoxin 1